jgi:hypothetical protein
MSDPNAGASKAPWHLWVIGIIGVAWNAIGAVDYSMTQTENEAYLKAVPPEQLAFITGVPAWVVAAWAIGVWGGVAGMLLLLLRKRAAVPVLLASLVGAALVFVHNYLLSEGAEVMGSSGMAFAGMIVVIALGLYWYARLMRRRGVLR